MSDAPGPVTVTPLGHGRYLVDDGSKRRLGFAVSRHETWVFLDGRTWVVPDPDRRPSRRAAGEAANALSAPMPATVLAVHVGPGQAVKRDDVLVVLEAMKMELPIRAPRDGVVARVTCRTGELVQPGVTLVELEGGAANG